MQEQEIGTVSSVSAGAPPFQENSSFLESLRRGRHWGLGGERRWGRLRKDPSVLTPCLPPCPPRAAERLSLRSREDQTLNSRAGLHSSWVWHRKCLLYSKLRRVSEIEMSGWIQTEDSDRRSIQSALRLLGPGKGLRANCQWLGGRNITKVWTFGQKNTWAKHISLCIFARERKTKPHTFPRNCAGSTLTGLNKQENKKGNWIDNAHYYELMHIRSITSLFHILSLFYWT